MTFSSDGRTLAGATTYSDDSVITHWDVATTRKRQSEAREIIELLLEYGADPSIKNKNGKTPADYAANEEIIALLTKST